MSEPFFYYPQSIQVGATFTLSGEEARHAAVTRRLREGEVISLFDGNGNVAEATILAADKRSPSLDLNILQLRTDPKPLPSIHLASALPKGDRMAVLLDMATQLGMQSFTPLQCAYSVVAPRAQAERRWQRICLEACKQSRRAYLPVIHPPVTPEEAGRRASAGGATIVIADPAGKSPQELTQVLQRQGDILLFIGPEGGFTQDEIRVLAAQGGLTVSLGDGLLRIETAAATLMACIALLGYE